MIRVLIVDDDAWQADCLTRWLSDKFSVDLAISAQQALDKLDQKRFNLIVLDLFLGHANGVQLLNTLASHNDLSKIPVLVCSNLVPSYRIDWRNYGVMGVVDKTTLDRTSFLKAVRNATLAK